MPRPGEPIAKLTFDAEVIYWRGPAPFFYVPLPEQAAEEVRGLAPAVSYGWGMIPVEAQIAGARFATSLFPKAGTYYLPLKDAVRDAAQVTAGDAVTVELTVVIRRP